MPTRRGTSNRDERGSSADRASRRAWLLENYRADVDVIHIDFGNEEEAESRVDAAILVGTVLYDAKVANGSIWQVPRGAGDPACRCYRCGRLLIECDLGSQQQRDGLMLTIDRIIPGCQGGTYARNNIRPACEDCNTTTGGALASQAKTSPRHVPCPTCGAKRGKVCNYASGKPASYFHVSRRRKAERAQ